MKTTAKIKKLEAQLKTAKKRRSEAYLKEPFGIEAKKLNHQSIKRWEKRVDELWLQISILSEKL